MEHHELAKCETAHIQADDFRRKMGYSDAEWEVLASFSSWCPECDQKAHVSSPASDANHLVLSCGHWVPLYEWVDGFTGPEMFAMFKEALKRR